MRQQNNLIQSAVLFAAAGALLLDLALVSQNISPPVPRPVQKVSAAPGPKQRSGSHPLPASKPVSISIPSIEVSSSLVTVGLQPDGTPSVPTGEDVDKAAWLDSSVTPGETGTSVIIGHLTSIASGPSVFYELGSMVQGQQISIRRQDDRTVQFFVNRVQSYDKHEFPSQEVYGRTDFPSLRLITCGGDWDESTQQYSQNVVVYATIKN